MGWNIQLILMSITSVTEVPLDANICCSLSFFDSSMWFNEMCMYQHIAVKVTICNNKIFKKKTHAFAAI